MMYVLYYHHDAGNGADCEIIAVSPSRRVIESKIAEMIRCIRETDGIYQEYRKMSREYYERCKDKVRDFLRYNEDAILERPEHDRNSWDYLPQWHATSTKPYAPQVIREKKDLIIKELVEYGWHRFHRNGDKYSGGFMHLDFSKIKGPMLLLDETPPVLPCVSGRHYVATGLRIADAVVLPEEGGFCGESALPSEQNGAPAR